MRPSAQTNLRFSFNESRLPSASSASARRSFCPEPPFRRKGGNGGRLTFVGTVNAESPRGPVGRTDASFTHSFADSRTWEGGQSGDWPSASELPTPSLTAAARLVCSPPFLLPASTAALSDPFPYSPPDPPPPRRRRRPPEDLLGPARNAQEPARSERWVPHKPRPCPSPLPAQSRRISQKWLYVVLSELHRSRWLWLQSKMTASC